MENTNNYLLKVDDLKTWFPVRRGLLRRTVGFVKAVDGITFAIGRGRTLGLVGESGCGKTTAARTIARLIPATSGEVTFEDKDVLKAHGGELIALRKEISIIFRTYGSLNPRMTIGNIVGEPLKVHSGITGSESSGRVAVLLSKVGLSPEHANRYPHEFSGGQRQRIGVARALSLRPKLVICDEPVSALDVSIQSQILNLLKDLQDEFGLTYLFIAHDLAVVEFFCELIAVMYMGMIVEQASSAELYRNPAHPYTRVLMSAIPQVDPGRRTERLSIAGEVGDAATEPAGCLFEPRCVDAEEVCRRTRPPLGKYAGGEDHLVACWKCKKRFDISG